MYSNKIQIRAFSVTTKNVIITYDTSEGYEINAIIPAYLAATILCDLHVLKNRVNQHGKLIVDYKDEWRSWRDFLIDFRENWEGIKEYFIINYLQREAIKNAYFALNN